MFYFLNKSETSSAKFFNIFICFYFYSLSLDVIYLILFIYSVIDFVIIIEELPAIISFQKSVYSNKMVYLISRKYP